MHSVGDFVGSMRALNKHLGWYLVLVLWCSWSIWCWSRNLNGRTLLEFCLDNVLCLSKTLFTRKEKTVTFKLGENETEIYFVLVKK